MSASGDLSEGDSTSSRGPLPLPAGSRRGERREPLQRRRKGLREHRLDGQSVDRAWPEKAPRVVRSCACLARFATAMALRNASSAAAELAGSCFNRISPRARCSSASNVRWPTRSAVASASSRMATARPGSPARASASASAIFTRPSKIRMFCARKLVDGFTHVIEAQRRSRRSRRLPNPGEIRRSAPHRQLVLASELGKLDGVRSAASVVATHQFEQGRVHSSKRERPDMGALRHPRLHTINERNRPIHLAERP